MFAGACMRRYISKGSSTWINTSAARVCQPGPIRYLLASAKDIAMNAVQKTLLAAQRRRVHDQFTPVGTPAERPCGRAALWTPDTGHGAR